MFSDKNTPSNQDQNQGSKEPDPRDEDLDSLPDLFGSDEQYATQKDLPSLPPGMKTKHSQAAQSTTQGGFGTSARLGITPSQPAAPAQDQYSTGSGFSPWGDPVPAPTQAAAPSPPPQPQQAGANIARNPQPGASPQAAPSLWGENAQETKPGLIEVAPDASDPLIGSLLNDRYRVIAVCGRGGVGAVYKVQHVATQKLCAAKVMNLNLISDKMAVQRFQQAATAGSRLSHPNTATISDLGMTSAGQPYVIMDLLDGRSLADEIRVKGRIEIARCIHIFAQACSAIGHAHDKAIVHRNLKPSNILLVESEGDPDFVKVVDFGLAGILPEHGMEAAGGDAYTNALYMSPEQSDGGQLDATSDVYSLGCVFYESLTGWTPFEGKNINDTLNKHKNSMPPTLSGIPGEPRQVKRLESIVFKAISKSRDARYQSMREFKNDLDALVAQAAKPKAPALIKFEGATNILSAIGERIYAARKILIALILLVVVMGGTAGGVYFWYNSYKDPDFNDRIIPADHVFSEWKDAAKFAQARDMLIQTEKGHDANWAMETQEGMAFKKKLGDFYREGKKFDDALREYQAALNAIREQHLEETHAVEAGELYAKIAELYYLAGKTKEARDFAQMAISTFKKTGKHGTGDVLIAYYTMIYCLSRMGQFVPADIVMTQLNREVIATANKSDPNDSLKIALSLQAFAELSLRRKEYDRALRSFQEVNEMWKEFGPDAELNRAATYNQLGMIELADGLQLKGQAGKSVYANGQLSQAMDDLNKAKATITQLKGTDNVDYAKVLFNLSDAYWAKEKYADSIKTKLEARRLWSKYSSTLPPAVEPVKPVRAPVN